ncbi:16S rRNA (guanine(966)-N(2))-methyltransferase RsmD [Thalassospira sp. GB04J01]|uniref:16S rRNA (guanine(966)-N(2))-methyltransferase RsmD n=1 Tax=Thalassospira sp. GB04J01 TaxID=1485225 RepID=UPI000C9B31B8|nr:16S rRNA (guanine(966)-N(2))-methyltransferase RsmD [Thalassospira sp. GB04J01]|tara:strand:+ start:149491 stop:150060 length:570 start_codon:yes stop_codon:yes gene_type:complete
MRIVGGSHRGRALTPPAGRETRPTLDRVREALFSILSHASRWYEDDFHPLFDGVILDAYAGSGALGLEAISRGASKAVLFDTDRGALAVIEENITNLKLGDKARVQRADATKPPRASAPASMVFLDPPYGKQLLETSITALAAAGWIDGNTLIIAERDPRDPEITLDGFELCDSRKYGKCQIDIGRFSA